MAPEAATIDGGEPVTVDGKRYLTVKEGLATILVQANEDDDRKVQQVFYNPIQQFNRDLTVLVIKAYGEETLMQRRKQRQEKEAKKKRKRDEAGGVVESGKTKLARTAEKVEEAALDNGASITTSGIPDINDSTSLESNDVLMTDQGDATAVSLAKQSDSTESAVQPDHEVKSRNSTAPVDAAKETTLRENHDESAANGEQAANNDKPANRGPKFTILDALSASGLRALRYGHEIPFATSITANDLSVQAAESIRRNVAYNELDNKIQVTQGDANAHMMNLILKDLIERDHYGNPGKSHKYDVVDLDPYGTAAPFWDNALNSVRIDGGLLCVTCTDSAIWAGTNYAEKCEALYGGQPVHSLYCHESGLRLIIGAIAAQAAKHGLAIEPLLSLSIDFYARVFIKVTKSPAAVKFYASKKMTMYHCQQGCGAWTTQYAMKAVPMTGKDGTSAFHKHVTSLGPPGDEHCRHCGTRTRLGGPMYGGYLHSPDFIKRVLEQLPTADPEVYKTLPRIEGMLHTALEECLRPEEKADTEEKRLAMRDQYPFYVVPSLLAKILKCTTPNDDIFRGALRHLGYRTARSHCKAGSIKTDAPWGVIWRLMREWVRQKSPVPREKLSPNSAGYRLLGFDEAAAEAAEPTTVADASDKGSGSASSADVGGKSEAGAGREELWATLVFDQRLRNLGKQVDEKHLVRYQVNPRENWGPMSKAKGH